MYVLNMFITITSLIHIVTFHKTAQIAPTVAAWVVRHLAARMETKKLSHFHNNIRPMPGQSNNILFQPDNAGLD